jgi:hypothetical protein
MQTYTFLFTCQRVLCCIVCNAFVNRVCLHDLFLYVIYVISVLNALQSLCCMLLLSPIRCAFASSCVDYKKGCTRLAAASDKAYQLLSHGRWISPGTPSSSTTKTGRHDIAEILLKVELRTRTLLMIVLYELLGNPTT